MSRRYVSQDGGWSIVEVVVVLAVVATLSAIATPLTQTTIDAGRARQAAGFVASRFRMARQRAIAQSATEAVVFDKVGDRWAFRVCVDGNGNGVRRTELGGPDQCIDGPHELEALYPQIRVALDPAIPDPAGRAGSDDPVRFGVSDIASFTPAGTATSGTLYLRSSLEFQYAVRVYGLNGRTRILRYDPATAQWREM